MRFIVFSILLALTGHTLAADRFTSTNCLKSTFETNIEHKTYLFGLLTARLNIKKNECILKINFKEILEKKWEIDLCREPIHIKHQKSGSLAVYKKEKSCDQHNDEFCNSYQELQNIIQDHGLIFAKGDREKLSDDHGRVYCSYLLINKYLGHDSIFSLYSQPDDIYTHQKESCELPPREQSQELEKSDSLIEEKKVETKEQEDINKASDNIEGKSAEEQKSF